MISATPSLVEFDPNVIPYQHRVIQDIRKNYDYSLGVHEILLSGALGSAKSTLLAHIAVTHCLNNSNACFLIGRLSMPALRATLFQKIIEHIGGDLKDGRDYFINETTATIRFKNKSKILSRSWSDRKFFKVRSLELSGAAIEETTENEESDFYHEIKMRVGRLRHINEKIIIHATNPSDPSHWMYKYFIEPNSGGVDHQTKHVYYSKTEENPFLPDSYITQLKKDLDPKMAERMLYGVWNEIKGNVVYHQYDQATQYKRRPYSINPAFPVTLSWDFNLADGKPMSMCCMQYIDDTFHIFDEVVIDGARTADTIEELDHKGLLKAEWDYQICGDAAGKHRDTRGSRSDWDIILKELQNRNLKTTFLVPPSNPGVRNRHNRVNAYCKNAEGAVRLFVYEKAPTVDEGFRLVKLKPGANYIEDDSKRYQHVLTSAGYAIYMLSMMANRKAQSTTLL